MTTAATSLLGLALPVTGELSGTWGDTVNNSITALLDSAVAGTTTLSADADVTLTTTTLAANQAREAIILWTAGGTVTRNITAPAQSKTYVVLNKTSSTQSIVIRGAGPTTGVTVLAGKQAMVAWDGTDFVEVSSGYVDGPASSTDNAVARFDGTDGKTIQNSVVIIADTTGNMSGVGTLGVGAITTSGALVGAVSQDAFNTVSTTLNLGGAATTVNIGAATGTLTVANATLAAKAVTATAVTNSALTATRLVYSGTAGLEVDSANLTFNGTILTSTGFAGPLNGTVGATTPAAGAFTTLSTTGAVTITGGTANGVAYLNGSKVLTTGTALTFDGTTTLGLTVAGTGAVLNGYNVTNGTASGIFKVTGSTYSYRGVGSNVLWVGGDGNSMYVGTSTDQPLLFGTNAYELMRLDSTGLGIGTSSPRAKVDVTGSVLVNYQTSTNYPALSVKTTSSVTTPSTFTNAISIWNGTTVGDYSNITFGYNTLGITNAAAYMGFVSTSAAGSGKGDLVFGTRDVTTDTAATEQVRITSAGNVGIGTSSPGAKFDVQTSGVGIQLKQNATGSATYYVMDNTVETGGKRWRFGYTGSAGISTFSLYNATNDVTAWVADSAGNLGLGVTPSAWGSLIALDISSYGSVFGFSNQAGLTGNCYYNGSSWVYKATAAATQYQQISGQHIWYNAASGSGTFNFTQAMTLTAAGDLAVGATSSDGSRLFVLDASGDLALFTNGANADFAIRCVSGVTSLLPSTGVLVFGTNNTERARIDASGNLCVGATAKVYDGKISVGFASTGSQGIALIDNTATTGGIYAYFINSAGNVAGSISHSTTTGVLYNVTSDYRLKDIAGPVTNSGAFIDKLNPVQGSWKNDGSRFIGFLAHELQEASETVVATGVKDGDEMQSIDYSNAELIANLVAELQSLRKRIAALEAK
jgi:hypothetical protein